MFRHGIQRGIGSMVLVSNLRDPHYGHSLRPLGQPFCLIRWWVASRPRRSASSRVLFWRSPSTSAPGTLLLCINHPCGFAQQHCSFPAQGRIAPQGPCSAGAEPSIPQILETAHIRDLSLDQASPLEPDCWRYPNQPPGSAAPPGLLPHPCLDRLRWDWNLAASRAGNWRAAKWTPLNLGASNIPAMVYCKGSDHTTVPRTSRLVVDPRAQGESSEPVSRRGILLAGFLGPSGQRCALIPCRCLRDTDTLHPSPGTYQ